MRDNGGVQGYRDDGVVLRTQKLGEADRIITLLTRHNGRVRAVARGIRRTKSRFGARLEQPRRRRGFEKTAHVFVMEDRRKRRNGKPR